MRAAQSAERRVKRERERESVSVRERAQKREIKKERERESIQRYLLFVVLDAQDAVFGRFWFPNDSHDVVFQFP
jgi:cytidylate kinase